MRSAEFYFLRNQRNQVEFRVLIVLIRIKAHSLVGSSLKEISPFQLTLNFYIYLNKNTTMWYVNQISSLKSQK